MHSTYTIKKIYYLRELNIIEHTILTISYQLISIILIIYLPIKITLAIMMYKYQILCFINKILDIT